MTTDEEAVAAGRETANEWRHTEAAFDKVEAAIIKTLADTPIGQETKVLNLHKALQNCAAVRQAIMDVIVNGQVAEVAISQVGLTSPH